MPLCHHGDVSARAAAFFDLDKTILAKSSSLAFAKPLYDGGLIGRTDVLKSAYAQLVYLTSGADHDQMERMRVYLSELSRGWDVEQVKAVVAETLDGIVDPIVYQEAMKLIAEHQEAGRDVIIISSSGTEIVEPIGARLGVDKAIGTQMVIEDGKYTGDILFYAYGPGKADAMRQLAEDEGYDLADSYAYSDSYTDLPMLEVVGHPFAVNPDEQLRRVARERVWPVLEFAKPVAMQRTVTKEQKTAAGAAGAAAAVALGLAWYARYRRGR
ncbi:MAG: HAD family hydrolase [Actinobacteria bacterium]|nr:HAD family hydrolase [Actinomycetota bacterium]MCB8997925.1 HAD family hydrolase [Actinomycetota bacterium]MCB9414478.1 HAD family hydrolase [Actinomycetota bacterium]